MNVSSQNTSTKSELNRSYLIIKYCIDLNGHAVVNIYPTLLWQQLYLIWLCNNGCRLTNTLPTHCKMAFGRPTIPEMALPEHNCWRFTSTCCLKRSPANCSCIVFLSYDQNQNIRLRIPLMTAVRQTEKDLYKRKHLSQLLRRHQAQVGAKRERFKRSQSYSQPFFSHRSTCILYTLFWLLELRKIIKKASHT